MKILKNVACIVYCDLVMMIVNLHPISMYLPCQNGMRNNAEVAFKVKSEQESMARRHHCYRAM